MRLHPGFGLIAALAGGINACGGGTDPGPDPVPTFTLGGTVAGLAGGGLVLQNNAGNDLSVGAGASSFTFSGAVGQGAAYSVSVKIQPSNPAQTCTVTGGTGTIGAANVTSEAVACTTAASSTRRPNGSEGAV